MALVALGIKAGDPSFDLSSMAGSVMLLRIQRLEADTCFAASFPLMAEEPVGSLRPGWQDAEGVVRFAEANRPYLEPGRGPLLIIVGENDPAIPLDITELAVQKRREIDPDLTFTSYPGMDHDGVIVASFQQQKDWLEERFAGARIAADRSQTETP
ncbi:MAG: hypothetical protein ABIO06_08290 [Pseudolysinimonas sp.]